MTDTLTKLRVLIGDWQHKIAKAEVPRWDMIECVRDLERVMARIIAEEGSPTNPQPEKDVELCPE
jgi:hypothetical protein